MGRTDDVQKSKDKRETHSHQGINPSYQKPINARMKKK
jgi:hypothetical protein